MTETIKVEVDDALTRRFRRNAMETYGYKKGTIKKAVEDVITKFSMTGHVDWASLRGKLRVVKSFLRPVTAQALVESRLILLDTNSFLELNAGQCPDKH